MRAPENGMVEWWKIGMLEKSMKFCHQMRGISTIPLFQYTNIPLIHDYFKKLL